MAAAAKTSTAIELAPTNIQSVAVPIIGDTPLICHAWSAKAKKQMLDKHLKRAASGRAAKDPWQDFCESLYWLDGMPEKPTEGEVISGRFGMPSIAFKSAAITAVTTIGSLTKVMARQVFHLDDEFVEILGPPPSQRFDICTVGMTKDTRFRGEFHPWGAILKVKFNANVLSAEQVVGLFEAGGFGVGVGEWRPEKDGTYGRFHVARPGEVIPCR
jgi:hypothetical protein